MDSLKHSIMFICMSIRAPGIANLAVKSSTKPFMMMNSNPKLTIVIRLPYTKVAVKNPVAIRLISAFDRNIASAFVCEMS